LANKNNLAHQIYFISLWSCQTVFLARPKLIF